MAFCEKCGKEINDNAFMCVYCGTLTPAGNKLQAKPAVVKRNSLYTLGVVGMIFALFFQAVTWICCGIGLARALKRKKEYAKQCAMKPQEIEPLTSEDGQEARDDASATPATQELSPTQLQYQRECEEWQIQKAIQLNFAALIVSCCIFVVWLLGGLLMV